MGTVWCHADHEDAERLDGNEATREEAIASGRNEYGSGAFYVFRCETPDPAGCMPDADDVIETAQCRSDDNWGEVAEDWPDVTDEAKAELTEFLAEWARKHAQCNFWIASGPGELIPAVETPSAGEQ